MRARVSGDAWEDGTWAAALPAAAVAAASKAANSARRRAGRTVWLLMVMAVFLRGWAVAVQRPMLPVWE
ncbi:hypothetical protein ABMY26_09650 [Azospirillum sp. HJ39]|uniref:hypothetical protein n=1 Tax=Azospirillum sp. HJ39 TaxID=3159496 RepID=UPI003555D653